MKEIYAALENLVWVSQLGLSLLLPLVVFLWLARWLTETHGWPLWIYIPCLLLGLATGAQTFRKFARRMMKQAGRKKDGRDPVGFNKH